MIDTIDFRVITYVGSVQNLRVGYEVGYEIPLTLALGSEIVNRSIITNVNQPLAVGTTILNMPTDPDYDEVNATKRFTFITKVKSPITMSRVIVIHDDKHGDIIILPDSDMLYLDELLVNANTPILSCVSCTGATIRDQPNQPKATRKNIPLTNSNIGNTCTVTMLPGVTNCNVGDRYSETMITSTVNYSSLDNLPGTIINLGNASNLFPSPTHYNVSALIQKDVNRFTTFPVYNMPSRDVYDNVLVMNF